MYQLTKTDAVIRIEDGAFIPNDSDNIDRQRFDAWVAAGNTPLPAETPTEARARLWDAIKSYRDTRAQTGGYQVAGNWFHSDTFSRSQQLGLALMGAGMPAGIKWKTMAGTFVDMTPTLAQQILSAGAAQDNATFKAAETHKAAMEASPNPASYDYSAGWPAIFPG